MQAIVLYITLLVKWYKLYPTDQERAESLMAMEPA